MRLIASARLRRYGSAVPPPPALVDRFRRDWRALRGPGDARFGVAVSGGPDSLALLLLAAAAFPGAVRAATVDHGLRARSAAEAAAVARVCADVGVPHTVLRVEVAPTGEGLQAAARDARYAALAAWAAEFGALATAHHADDQAETLLMRLARGAGLGGLSGIRPVRAIGGVTLLRPLLGWRKVELAAIVAEAGLAVADDPSNRDPRFDRTRARALLAGADWIDPLRLAASAAHLAEAEAALAWTTAEAARSRLSIAAGEIAVDAADLPAELQRRLVVLALARAGVAPDGPALDRLLAALRAGKPASIGEVQAIPGACWRFVAAPGRRFASAKE